MPFHSRISSPGDHGVQQGPGSAQTNGPWSCPHSSEPRISSAGPANPEVQAGTENLRTRDRSCGSLDINQRGAGVAYQLASQTGLVSRIAIWDLDSALLTVNIEPRSHLLFAHQIGPRIPAYCSAVGKALLSFLNPGNYRAMSIESTQAPHREHHNAKEAVTKGTEGDPAQGILDRWGGESLRAGLYRESHLRLGWTPRRGDQSVRRCKRYL